MSRAQIKRENFKHNWEKLINKLHKTFRYHFSFLKINLVDDDAVETFRRKFLTTKWTICAIPTRFFIWLTKDDFKSGNYSTLIAEYWGFKSVITERKQSRIYAVILVNLLCWKCLELNLDWGPFAKKINISPILQLFQLRQAIMISIISDNFWSEIHFEC